MLNNLRDPYPQKEERIKMAAEIGLTERQVQMWMQNNRKRRLRPIMKYAQANQFGMEKVRELVRESFQSDRIKSE